MKRLEILTLYDCIAPESVGGVEQRNLELARALARRGHRITLAGWASSATKPEPGVRVLPLGAPGALYTTGGKRRTSAAIRFALDVLRTDLRGYDLVETANIPYLHLLALAPRCAAAGIPLCVTWHEYWGPYWREYLGTPWWPAYAFLEGLTARLGTGAIAVSRLTAHRLARHRRGEIPVIGNGIPLEEIRAAAESADRVDTPLIYAGRLLAEKRVDLLLEAVRSLVDKGLQGCLLTVVGDGPDRSRLEEMARTLELDDAVRFLGRLPTEKDVWRALGRARIAVQPSSREGFGRFPLEAMAAGCPVVYCSSEESAVGEIVRDGVEGLRSAPDPESLANALWRLVSPEGEPLRTRLANHARRRAGRYSWESLAAKIEAVYVGLVEARR